MYGNTDKSHLSTDSLGKYGVHTQKINEIDFADDEDFLSLPSEEEALQTLNNAMTPPRSPISVERARIPELTTHFLEEREDKSMSSRRRVSQITPLHTAVKDGDPVKVGAILANKGRAAVYLNAVDEEGDSALHMAARDGNLEAVKVLVKAGAVLDIEDPFKSTPLHDAAQEGHVDVVQFLASSGAEINRFDQNGGAPLHDAAWEGHVEVVEVLVKHGGIPNIMNSNGHTPLVMAKNAHHNHVVVVLERLMNEMQSGGKPVGAAQLTRSVTTKQVDALTMRAKLSSRTMARKAGTRSFFDYKPVPLEFPARVRKTAKKKEVFEKLEEEYKDMQIRMKQEAESAALQMQATYDSSLSVLESTFDRRQAQLTEAFEVRKLQMQTDFEDQLEKLRRELAQNQMEHEVRFNEAVGKHQMVFEEKQEVIEKKLRTDMEALQGMVGEAQQQTEMEFQGLLQQEITTLEDKESKLEKMKRRFAKLVTTSTTPKK